MFCQTTTKILKKNENNFLKILQKYGLKNFEKQLELISKLFRKIKNIQLNHFGKTMEYLSRIKTIYTYIF